MAAGFTWGSLAGPLEHGMKNYGIDPHVGIDALFVSVVMIGVAFVAGKPYRSSEMVEPSGKLNFSTFVETIVEGLYNFCKGMIPDANAARSLFFLFGSLVFFILPNNLIGLVSGFNPPTDDFSTTIVLGLVVFVATHIVGFKFQGVAYFKQFVGPVWWLSWMILPIELISHIVRPFSLALRLFGNMTGDHKVVGIFFGLIPLILPIPFLGLGIFISFVQTFVFLLLSLVYIAGAMEHH